MLERLASCRNKGRASASYGVQEAVKTNQYRPDIDGLRAIAVSLVLVYQAFPKAVPGGFVGVDVFFVISGFLNTGIIGNQIAAGTFSLGYFYQRRIRRIFPALIVLLAASFVAGWFWFLPDEFEQLGLNTLASSAFAANVALLFQSGYFDIEATKKPLLHLWSLGIEEQFYIVWPIFMMAVARYRKAAIGLILLVGLISFVLNLVLVQGHRDASGKSITVTPHPGEYEAHTHLAFSNGTKKERQERAQDPVAVDVRTGRRT
jgi:peptidoglycan/LPS O-acetylase OafA/YrhL